MRESDEERRCKQAGDEKETGGELVKNLWQRVDRL